MQLWAKEEFDRLLEEDKDPIGKLYMCHKKNGAACVGFLMNQIERDIPSIATRLQLRVTNTPWRFLETLTCTAPRFTTVEEMAAANYPEYFDNVNP